MAGAPVILALAALALTPAMGGAPQDLFAEAQELLQAGRTSEALALADAAAEPVQRAQARLYVLHHGGDLAGALSAGLLGLAGTEDAWLLERTATLALDLGAGELGAELTGRLERLVGGDAELAGWGERTAELRARVDEHLEKATRSARSLRRARATVLAAGLLALLALGAGFRGARGAAAAASGGPDPVDA